MLGVLKVRVDWDISGNVEQIWEQVRAMVVSARKVHGSVKVGMKEPKICMAE